MCHCHLSPLHARPLEAPNNTTNVNGRSATRSYTTIIFGYNCHSTSQTTTTTLLFVPVSVKVNHPPFISPFLALFSITKNYHKILIGFSVCCCKLCRTPPSQTTQKPFLHFPFTISSPKNAPPFELLRNFPKLKFIP